MACPASGNGILVFETLAHHAAYQLAVVIGQRGILRAEIAHLPIVAQEQAHGNFVHKLAFSAAGNACDREHKTTLELDQPVQILQSRIGSFRHSVVINIHQRIPFVHGAEDSFQRDFRRLLHLLAEPRKIVLQQILVGILAAFPQATTLQRSMPRRRTSSSRNSTPRLSVSMARMISVLSSKCDSTKRSSH